MQDLPFHVCCTVVIRVVCGSLLGFINTEMDTMALEAREREKEREHPTASSVLPRPATRGVARSWSPHERNPTGPT